MLYLDTSALVKRYSSEIGTAAVAARFESGERIFTSRFTFAEVHASFGRKFRSGELTAKSLARVRENFHADWLFSLSILELDVGAMSALPQLVEQYGLRAGDAIHLSSAIGLRDSLRLRRSQGTAPELLEFGVADKKLGKIAEGCGLPVFDPEAPP